MPPLVSVVMPCFNAGRMLMPALRSVIAQSYPNIEIIFVDNNSTDGSAEQAQSIAAGSPRPFHLARCPEQGSNHARNLGYGLARGDYIQWMDADDALGIEKIARQVDVLERDQTAAIAYCDWLSSRHEAGGQRHDRVMSLRQVDDQILRTLSGVWYPPHTYLLRRQVAEALQMEPAWFPARKVGTDVEYSAIAAMLGMRFRHVPLARVQYNTWSPTQISVAGTGYAARVATFRDIYQRLRQIALRPDVAPRITARHRTLLDQDWNVWAMPPGSVEISALTPRIYQLRHVASGRTIEADPREATVATAMQAVGASRAIAHQALLISARAPNLGTDYPFIVATLERYRREGLLTQVDPLAEVRDANPDSVATTLPSPAA
jgi:hypothetical protein